MKAPPRPAEKRRVGRVDECAALEMRYPEDGITGSNPVPSALLRGREKPRVA